MEKEGKTEGKAKSISVLLDYFRNFFSDLHKKEVLQDSLITNVNYCHVAILTLVSDCSPHIQQLKIL